MRIYLAYVAFPEKPRTRMHSTNPLERLHKEAKRQTNSAEVFPYDGLVTRLVGAAVVEIAEELQAGRRTSASRGWPG